MLPNSGSPARKARRSAGGRVVTGPAAAQPLAAAEGPTLFSIAMMTELQSQEARRQELRLLTRRDCVSKTLARACSNSMVCSRARSCLGRCRW